MGSAWAVTERALSRDVGRPLGGLSSKAVHGPLEFTLRRPMGASMALPTHVHLSYPLGGSPHLPLPSWAIELGVGNRMR